jgi:hypothetical protein
MRLAVLAAGYVEERDGEERIMFPVIAPSATFVDVQESSVETAY